MRKNYFAKKFVAYTMAFAVAFSTLTVSPVFVKEAKAAGSFTINGPFDVPATKTETDTPGSYTSIAGDQSSDYNGYLLIGPVISKLSGSTDGNLTMNLSSFKELAGFEGKNIAGTINASKAVTIDAQKTANKKYVAFKKRYVLS